MSLRQPGTVFDGKYEIVKSLGRGGMGEVYLVRHLHLHEHRVVKVLRQDLAADETAQKRFTREARLATQIKHPNVAILYDFSRLPEGAYYMVWEHIEGRDVGEWIRGRGPLPVLPAINLAIQGLRGLEAIHASGVIHRDLSPDNLMITRDRRDRYLVKIIDLGLAKHFESEPNFEITQAGMFMGKLKYCSPEQAEMGGDDVLDRRTDLYSFGLVLYEMFTGLPPFDAPNPHGFVMKRLSEDPLPLTGRRPGTTFPEELEAVMKKALARGRDDRFSDAVAFIEALERVAYLLRQAGPIPPQRPAAPTEAEVGPGDVPPPPEGEPVAGGSSRELSRAERADLLAQIDRAARKKREGTQALVRLEELLGEGRLAEARELVGSIEKDRASLRGFDRLERRLAEAESAVASAQRLRDLEQMIEGYIQKRQVSLAELGFATLIEIAPTHPKRLDYESWIALMKDEVAEDRRAREAALAAREAAGQGDFRAARSHLEEVRRHDPMGEIAPALAKDLETAEREAQQTVDLGARRERLERFLEEGQVAEAEKELQALTRGGATKVTVDLLRSRLAEVRVRVERENRLQRFEDRFRRRLEAGDWTAARDVALELEKIDPSNRRPAAMFAEVAHREEAHRHAQAVEQGIRQVETFLGEGKVDQAELALKVVLQLDPDTPRRKRLEKQIRALRKG